HAHAHPVRVPGCDELPRRLPAAGQPPPGRSPHRQRRMPGAGVAADPGIAGGRMIDRSHYAVTSVSRPEHLVEAQAGIGAAVEAYLQAGGTIAQLDNKGKPVEHLSW